MINTVRNTVLSVLNKNNYGYLSPSDFNLFAKQAQLDIFENYFYEYNYQINKENARQSGTGYADIRKGIEEAIEIFSETKGLVKILGNLYSLPSQLTTGDDYYLLNKAIIYQTLLASGNTTATTGGSNKLIDSTADFTVGISVGDVIAYENGGVQYALVTIIDNATTITTNRNDLNAIGRPYAIYLSTSKFEEAEKVTHSKITMLNNSLLTAPNLTFPSYTQEANNLTAYPNTISNIGQVKAQYLRYPLEPKWTFITLVNGTPVFDQSSSDYQDFEIPLDDEVGLILKILQYAGVMIREAGVYSFAQAEENQDNQEES